MSTSYKRLSDTTAFDALFEEYFRLQEGQALLEALAAEDSYSTLSEETKEKLDAQLLASRTLLEERSEGRVADNFLQFYGMISALKKSVDLLDHLFVYDEIDSIPFELGWRIREFVGFDDSE